MHTLKSPPRVCASSNASNHLSPSRIHHACHVTEGVGSWSWSRVWGHSLLSLCVYISTTDGQHLYLFVRRKCRLVIFVNFAFVTARVNGIAHPFICSSPVSNTGWHLSEGRFTRPSDPQSLVIFCSDVVRRRADLWKLATSLRANESCGWTTKSENNCNFEHCAV